MHRRYKRKHKPRKHKPFIVVVSWLAVSLWGFVLLVNIGTLLANLSGTTNSFASEITQEQLSIFYEGSEQCEHVKIDDVIIMVERGEESLAYYTWENGAEGRKREQGFHRAVCQAFLQAGRQLADYEAVDIAELFIDPWIEFKGSMTERTILLSPLLILAAIVLYRNYKK